MILVLSLLFGFGTYFKVQPFSGILDLGRNISNSWDNKGVQVPDKQADVNGVSQELAFADTATERGLGEEEFYGYSERGEGRERHHGHDHKRDSYPITDEGIRSSISPQVAVRPREIDIKVNNNAKQTSDFQAPDDELHRRTNASCASCHDTSRW